MKIVHISDLHLGARLHEEDRGPEQDVILGWLADFLKKEKPDALLVCGDVFDVKAPQVHAQERYYRFLARLVADKSCREVVVTAGNHDSAKFLAAPESLLKALNVTVSAQAATGERVAQSLVAIEGKDGKPGMVIAPVPFMYEAELSNAGLEKTGPEASREERISAGWTTVWSDAIAAARAKMPGAAVVVMGHATLTDAKASDDESERCRRIGGLESYPAEPLEEADYAAMGHLHLPQEIGGSGKVHYSGSPLKMSFDEEAGEKCVLVAELNGAGVAPVVRKVAVPAPVPLETVKGTPDAVKRRLGELAAACGEAKRFVRLQFTDFEGALQDHLGACRELVKGTGMLILSEEDLRTRKSGGEMAYRALAEQETAQLKPQDVARQKLQMSRENYSAEQIEEAMKLFAIAEQTVRAVDGSRE